MKLIMLVRASCVYSPFIKKIFQEILWFSSAFEDCLFLVPRLMFCQLFSSRAAYQKIIYLLVLFCNVLESCRLISVLLIQPLHIPSVLLCLSIKLPSVLLFLCVYFQSRLLSLSIPMYQCILQVFCCLCLHILAECCCLCLYFLPVCCYSSHYIKCCCPFMPVLSQHVCWCPCLYILPGQNEHLPRSGEICQSVKRGISCWPDQALFIICLLLSYVLFMFSNNRTWFMWTITAFRK